MKKESRSIYVHIAGVGPSRRTREDNGQQVPDTSESFAVKEIQFQH